MAAIRRGNRDAQTHFPTVVLELTHNEATLLQFFIAENFPVTPEFIGIPNAKSRVISEVDRLLIQQLNANIIEINEGKFNGPGKA